MSHRISRRYFFDTLLAGAVPPGGFSSAHSLKRLGYKSPNEKLNIAGIGVGRPRKRVVVLGAVATHYEGKLLWDNPKGEIIKYRDANRWVSNPFSAKVGS